MRDECVAAPLGEPREAREHAKAARAIAIEEVVDAATQARIDSERVNAARLEEARAMRATAPSAQVAERLRLVPPESAYHAEAQSLVAELLQPPPPPSVAASAVAPRMISMRSIRSGAMLSSEKPGGMRSPFTRICV